MKNWFEKLISIDELKVSLLAISLIGVLILDAYMALKYHDVPPQLTTITIVIISALAGFNAISVVAGSITANRSGQMPMQNNIYGSNMYGSNMYGSGYGMNGMSNYGTSGMIGGLSNPTTSTSSAPQKMPIVTSNPSGTQSKI